MHLEQAVRVVRNFRRYRLLKSGKTQWYQAGPFIPQQLIPQTTAKQRRTAERLMTTKVKLCRVQQVDVRKIRSWQHCLRFKSLMWNVKNARRMQLVGRAKDPDIAGVDLPTLVWADGVWVLWNGNHRTTANVLLGKTYLNARCFKPARGSRASR